MALLKGKCLIEGCPSVDKMYCRGLCTSHYRMIRELVRQKKRTWEEFINVGMAQVPTRGVKNTQQRLRFLEMMKKKGLIKKIE